MNQMTRVACKSAIFSLRSELKDYYLRYLSDQIRFLVQTSQTYLHGLLWRGSCHYLYAGDVTLQHGSMIDHLAPLNSHTVNVWCCVFQCGSKDCCSQCCQDRPASSIMDSAQLLRSTSVFLILTVSLCVVLQVTQKTLWNPTWMSRAIRLRRISRSPTWITCFDDLQKNAFHMFFRCPDFLKSIWKQSLYAKKQI